MKNKKLGIQAYITGNKSCNGIFLQDQESKGGHVLLLFGADFFLQEIPGPKHCLSWMNKLKGH